MRFQQIAGLALLSVVISAMISCGVQLCHGEETGPEKPLPSVISDIPLAGSLVGTLVSGQQIVDDDGRIGTALRVHPMTAYALYDTGIVFCGDVSNVVTESDGRHLLKGNVVFIYRMAASRLINGVPCHDLKAVLRVKQ